jgi:hypothetical protein
VARQSRLVWPCWQLDSFRWLQASHTKTEQSCESTAVKSSCIHAE